MTQNKNVESCSNMIQYILTYWCCYLLH